MLAEACREYFVRPSYLLSHPSSRPRHNRDTSVDAVIAATALILHPPVVVLTSDKPDFDLLLEGTGIVVEHLM